MRFRVWAYPFWGAREKTLTTGLPSWWGTCWNCCYWCWGCCCVMVVVKVVVVMLSMVGPPYLPDPVWPRKYKPFSKNNTNIAALWWAAQTGPLLPTSLFSLQTLIPATLKLKIPLVPFGSLLAPFGSLLVPLGFALVPFWLTCGSVLFPWGPFCRPSAPWRLPEAETCRKQLVEYILNTSTMFVNNKDSITYFRELKKRHGLIEAQGRH